MTEESIFAEALAIADTAERVAYLERACGNNAEMRAAVEALLAAHGVGSPLDQPPVSLAKTGPFTARLSHVGDRLGPYKLLEQVGEGGMGEVWVADQTEPIKRRVALKLIKPGMDTRAVMARFEAERQALAVMDHPNIAKVFDAGQTTDGRPYFVMELVKGVPITEFCDIRKLSPKERLELFVPVCQAIQHAHMKGIIHRDIKPTNVLVALHDEVPVPKVIDFGVAKAVGVQLTDKTVYTGFGTLIGTPAYMAPEQATFNQLDVDTRADVYALGVLLYELLAGSPPIEKERLKQAALDEVLRIVREEEPPRPSQRLSTAETRASIAAVRGTEPDKLSALMKGELDWIVMKALEKDRTRRYETANGFAADVQRYLAGEQVQAVPPSVGYRLKKTYRKNKAAVWAGTSIAALLLLGIVGTSLGLWEAQIQKENAVAAQSAQANQLRETEAALDLVAKQEKIAVQERIAAETARDNARRTHYAAQMNLAHSAFRENRGPKCLELLNELKPTPGEPDLRGPEWHYLRRQFFTEEHKVHIPDLVGRPRQLSRDGTRIVARLTTNISSEPNTFAVFDAKTGARLKTLTVPGVDLSPEEKARKERGFPNPNAGNDLITYGQTLSNDGGVVLFTSLKQQVVVDANSGKILFREVKPVEVRSAPRTLLSGNGQRLVLSDIYALWLQAGRSKETTERIIDLTTGKEVRTRTSEDATIGISRDGTRLILRHPINGIRIEETDTGKELAKFDVRQKVLEERFQIRSNRLYHAELVDDNKYLLLNTYIGGDTSIDSTPVSTYWEVATGKRIDVASRSFQLTTIDSHGQTGLIHAPSTPTCIEWVRSVDGAVIHKFHAPEPLAVVAFDKSEDQVIGISLTGWVRTWRLPDEPSRPPMDFRSIRGIVAENRTATRFALLQSDGVPGEGAAFKLRLCSPDFERPLQEVTLPEGTVAQRFNVEMTKMAFDPNGTKLYGVRLLTDQGLEATRACLWEWDTVTNQLRSFAPSWNARPSQIEQRNGASFALSPDGQIAVGVVTRGPKEALERAFVLLDPRDGSILRTTDYVQGELEYPEFDATGTVLWGRVFRDSSVFERYQPNDDEAKIVRFDVASGKLLGEIRERGLPEERDSLKIVGDTIVYRRRSRPTPSKATADGPKPVSLLPPSWQTRLGLTDEQKQLVAELEKEAAVRADRLLTEEQRQQLKRLNEGTLISGERAPDGGPPVAPPWERQFPGGGGRMMGVDSRPNECVIADARTGREIAIVKEAGYFPRFFSVSPTGEYLAAVYLNTQDTSFLTNNLLDRDTRERAPTLVVVYSCRTGQELYRFAEPNPLPLNVPATCFSSDGKRLLVASGMPVFRGTSITKFRFLDSTTGRVLLEEELRDWYNAMRFSADGHKIILESRLSRTTRIIDCRPLPDR